MYIYRSWSLTIRGPVRNDCIEACGEVTLPAETPTMLLTDAVLADDAELSALMQGLKEEEGSGAAFALKHINIVDPLCSKNNLGRSVSRSSSYRIPRAFRRGWLQVLDLRACLYVSLSLYLCLYIYISISIYIYTCKHMRELRFSFPLSCSAKRHCPPRPKVWNMN